MTNKLGYRDGGKTSEEGINRITSRLLVNAGVLAEDALEVTEAGSPDNTVVVAVGDIAIGDNSPSATAPAYYYHGWVDSAHAETVSANASGNPRIDVIVAFVDLTVVDDTNSDNPGALDFMIVAGTPGATPAAPDDSAIQTAVGASNPWIALAQIDVANGFSSITDSDITDLRPQAFTPQRVAGDTSIDLVGTGLLWSQDSGLVGQMTSGYALIGKTAVSKGYLKHTFTASKDTYVDLAIGDKPTSVDDLTYTEVTNGNDAPALAADSIRLAKVVTDGSGITGVTTSGVDSEGVAIRPSKNIAVHTHANDAEGGNTLTTPSIGDFTNSVHDHEDAAGGGLLDENAVRNATAFRAYRSGSDQTMTSSTSTKIQFNAVDYDLGNNFDETTEYAFIAPYDGVYHFAAGARIRSGGSGTRTFINIYKNGAKLMGGTDYGAQAVQAAATDVVQLEAGDEITIEAFVVAASNPGIQQGIDNTWFSGYLVTRT